ncbi:MAG TPA: HAD family hydrolase [Chromatiales bacterium]|nr:HAD family hydrolase [Chromatiales bacterium]
MSVALFDLDNTLLDGDSDYEWGRFLVDHGVVDGAEYERRNREFYAQYRAGRLDIHAFAAFAYTPLATLPMERLLALRETFLRERIRPMMLPAALALIAEHRRRGHRILVVTATNRFVTEPIAAAFGADDLIATEPVFRNGRYEARIAGVPAFREGKTVRVRQWLDRHGETWADSWFYSDSHNDLPLLEAVDHPVAVDPDEKLAQVARQRGWPIVTLRDGRTARALHG